MIIFIVFLDHFVIMDGYLPMTRERATGQEVDYTYGRYTLATVLLPYFYNLYLVSYQLLDDWRTITTSSMAQFNLISLAVGFISSLSFFCSAVL